METITLEALTMNMGHYIQEALKRGLRVITPNGESLTIAKGEPLTENGLTEREEQEIKARWNKARKDQEAGKLHRTSTPQEITALLESL